MLRATTASLVILAVGAGLGAPAPLWGDPAEDELPDRAAVETEYASLMEAVFRPRVEQHEVEAVALSIRFVDGHATEQEVGLVIGRRKARAWLRRSPERIWSWLVDCRRNRGDCSAERYLREHPVEAWEAAVPVTQAMRWHDRLLEAHQGSAKRTAGAVRRVAAGGGLDFPLGASRYSLLYLLPVDARIDATYFGTPTAPGLPGGMMAACFERLLGEVSAFLKVR